MDTYFASPERASDEDFRIQVEIASHNPIVDGVMGTVSGLLAVLNENRQVLALNETFLNMLGVKCPDQVLGLRPGEVLHCIRADEMPGGCGTSRYCSTCGAAIAIVSSLSQDRPEERTCAMTVERAGREVEYFLMVRSVPIELDNSRLLLLFLQDITRQQRLAALERTFFHDINNMLTGLVGASELLAENDTQDAVTMAENVYRLALRISQEVRIQQTLTQEDGNTIQSYLHLVSAKRAVEELQHVFERHPAAKDRTLVVTPPEQDLLFMTDLSLLLRVVSNMVINALEATPPGGEVRVWIERPSGGITFCVWNRQAIPENVGRRIFQRNFSTKQDFGRGLGTFSMKLLGEDLLGGQVNFVSTEAEGTTFRLFLPV